MKNIRNLYAENSSIELLSKVERKQILRKVLLEFLGRDIKIGFGDIRKWKVDEFDYKEQKTIDYGVEFLCERKVADFIHTYHFTDYTFVTTCRHVGDYYDRVEDDSDKWISYLLIRLKGEEKDRYLNGLKEFSNKISTDIQKQLLGAIEVEGNICK